MLGLPVDEIAFQEVLAKNDSTIDVMGDDKLELSLQSGLLDVAFIGASKSVN